MNENTGSPSDLEIAIRFYCYCLPFLAGLLLLMGPVAGIVRTDAAGVHRQMTKTQAGEIFVTLSSPANRPRLVYVHGTPGSALDWKSYLRDPLPGTTSVAFDRPGFGRSAKSGPLYTLTEQAQALAPMLQTVQGRKPILVGHSLGGAIVVRAALDYPGQIAGLVIIAGALDPELEKWHWYNSLADFPAIRLVLPAFLRNSNEELKLKQRQLERMEPMLSQLPCPVLIIHDTTDRLVPVENVDYMRDHFPPGSIWQASISNDKDHFIIWNDEERCRRLMSAFAEHCWQAEGLELAAGSAQ